MKNLKILLMAVFTILAVSGFAQKSENPKEKITNSQIADTVYLCPMKCEGDKTYSKAGKCPVCGMNLKAKINPATTTVFQCPMKCERLPKDLLRPTGSGSE